MQVYLVKIPGSNSCVFDKLQDAVDEVKYLLGEGTEEVSVSTREMSEEEYKNLIEHEGW